jgi:hypothetical protein
MHSSVKSNYIRNAQKTAYDIRGLEYTRAVRLEFLDNIHRNSGRAHFLEALSSNRSIWAVEYDGAVYPVVYDKRSKEIVAFLSGYYLNIYSSLLRM